MCRRTSSISTIDSSKDGTMDDNDDDIDNLLTPQPQKYKGRIQITDEEDTTLFKNC